MAFFVVFLSIIVCVLSTWYLLKLITARLKYANKLDKLPGPKAYPIIGNIPEIIVPPSKMLDLSWKLQKEYGPINRVWSAHIGIVEISKAEYMEVILKSTKETQKSVMYDLLQPWLGTGLLTSKGQQWVTHRKMLTPTFHFKILDNFVDVFIEKSAILIERLKRIPEGSEIDIYPYVTHCTLDIVCESIMGTNIHAQTDNSDYIKAVYDSSMLTAERQLRPWLMLDFIFYLTDYGKQYKKALKTLHSFTDKVIAERKAARQLEKSSGQTTRESNSDNLDIKQRKAFLDLLLDASEEGSKLTDSELRNEVDTFMFGGYDTTSVSTSWALYLLGLYPEHQDKIVKEIEDIFHGTNRAITISDLNEMKYLERVIKETLRLYPSVAIIGRELQNDVKTGDYIIPAGTQLGLNFFLAHRDPAHFPDPETFNPDNFLPEATKNRHPYAYLPFSAGPRNCIGQKFALLVEKVLLSSILRNFRIESVQKREELKIVMDLILRSANGIRVRLFPRNSQTSYPRN